VGIVVYAESGFLTSLFKDAGAGLFAQHVRAKNNLHFFLRVYVMNKLKLALGILVVTALFIWITYEALKLWRIP